MPTGWEVVLDLVNKLARLENEQIGPDPAEWYTTKYGRPPTYSGLLQDVAKSQAERSQLLRGYFEPSDEERSEGRKLPTKAHRSLAALVKMGMVRVIITTNFDPLIESALEAEGVHPTVISSPDDVDGAAPLEHARCAVIKVHGDYLDLRTRNTSTELEAYDERLDRLLDRIFDAFGLIVCGWSAEWDRALCKAIARAKGRRFTTYWTQLGGVTGAAQHLIDQRGAVLIPIKGADDFFDALAEKVRALADVQAPHPLSVQSAVAQAKRYLPEAKHQIRLHDLLMGEIETLIDETSAARYPVQHQLSSEGVVRRIADFEALSAVAASIIATGCLWGAEEHHSLWVKAINRLVNVGSRLSGNSLALDLARYPAVLLHYAAGIGAAAARKFGTILAILTQPRIRDGGNGGYFPIDLLRHVNAEVFKLVPGLERRIIPRNERLFSVLQEPLKILIPSESEYTEAFDLFETLQSLEAGVRHGWTMPGAFMYRYYVTRDGKRYAKRDGAPLTALEEDVRRLGEQADVLKAGFAQGSVAGWANAVKMIDKASEQFS
jgi:hypothetical protein